MHFFLLTRKEYVQLTTFYSKLTKILIILWQIIINIGGIYTKIFKNRLKYLLKCMVTKYPKYHPTHIYLLVYIHNYLDLDVQ